MPYVVRIGYLNHIGIIRTNIDFYVLSLCFLCGSYVVKKLNPGSF